MCCAPTSHRGIKKGSTLSASKVLQCFKSCSQRRHNLDLECLISSACLTLFRACKSSSVQVHVSQPDFSSMTGRPGSRRRQVCGSGLSLNQPLLYFVLEELIKLHLQRWSYSLFKSIFSVLASVRNFCREARLPELCSTGKRRGLPATCQIRLTTHRKFLGALVRPCF